MGLSEEIMNSSHKDLIVQDCCTMIDAQLASKSGLSGVALKTAFAALKGIQPGYIPNVIESLLPVCLTAIDPIWSEGVQQGEPVKYLAANSDKTADALLGVTDARVKHTKRQIVRGTYDKLRSSAKKHVEDAVPDLAQVIGKYANN
ncbi:hypothetical protein IQ226_14990 [Dolichospermum sp. LEGE 00240]|uniref:DUF6918 family protein n=1 Tax=Aphanizomenonaceae TaxID=1892259 RepID=UPI00187F5C49|nr:MULTISPECIES: hypothetical protein [Aphanizomenonaceae]MDM3846040.1 hypothetical protein [Aphanizomenon gracile PMC638.10]MDM3852099.1 hypothetical protein [Aphanizomenon gracile PMC627.10]MDM3856840.1 hypothetical protein [Aphanizomenon gracile PMC649.10]MDM3861079.1 hypothetical protein [Aphanizomenon gracile PMC644.10]MBE9250431.1 hypothetical protein [Dolichospermum sp. LEGE 00240]